MPTISPNLFCAGELAQAKILVIGHDRRLNRYSTLADTPFFADYFLRPIPTRPSELAKYRLSEALFSYVVHITNFRFSVSEVLITNLCNSPLPHAPAGKIVLIPIEEAQAGIKHLQQIINQSRIELILAMSEQVNYWLQKLNFCEADTEYIKRASPKVRGINSQSPYYEPSSSGAFRLICGKPRATLWSIPLFPIVHVKNWPLRGAFLKTYEKVYIQMINYLKSMEGGDSQL